MWMACSLSPLPCLWRPCRLCQKYSQDKHLAPDVSYPDYNSCTLLTGFSKFGNQHKTQISLNFQTLQFLQCYVSGRKSGWHAKLVENSISHYKMFIVWHVHLPVAKLTWFKKSPIWESIIQLQSSVKWLSINGASMREPFLSGPQIQSTSQYLLQDLSISWCLDLNFYLVHPFK